MAVTVKVRRVRNPARVRSRKRRVRNRSHRRRMTPRQIKFFGTRRQKAALRASRRRRSVSNPRHSARARVRVRRRVRRTRARGPVRNPALVVTLGAVNPKKRRASVARHRSRSRTRKRSNPSRRRHRRRNPTRVVIVAPRRSRRHRSGYRSRRRALNPRRYGRRRRRNPDFFGSRVASVASVKVILGGLVGVAAAKFLPTIVPISIVGSSQLIRVALTGASAYVASKAAEMFKVGPQTSAAVLFGGLMQTASVALNAFLPSVGRQLALSGLGELIPGQFPVPQNPLLIPAPAPRVTTSGLMRAFGSAY